LPVRQPGLRFTKNEAGGKPPPLWSSSASTTRLIPFAGSPASFARSCVVAARLVRIEAHLFATRRASAPKCDLTSKSLA
jgi:hypothetical protein